MMQQNRRATWGQISLQVLSNLGGRIWHHLNPGVKERQTMTRAVDVAKYVLEKTGPMTAMKLQKLVYYAQAWSLVWDERPLFADEIQAWRNGPVVPDLYNQHRGMFRIDASNITGDPSKIDADGRETIDVILGYYGEESAQYLSDLTHMEDPWKIARQGCDDGASSNQLIPHAAMADYYSAIAFDEPASSDN